MRTFRGGSNFICAAANQPNAREMPIHVIYFIRIGIHIQSIRRLLCLHHFVPTDDVLWFRMTWDVLASWKCVVHAFTSNNWHGSCQSNMPHSLEKVRSNEVKQPVLYFPLSRKSGCACGSCAITNWLRNSWMGWSVNRIYRKVFEIMFLSCFSIAQKLLTMNTRSMPREGWRANVFYS